MRIPVFTINLKCRTDRRHHILQQFFDKQEFDVRIVEAYNHADAAIGLWKSITKILQSLVDDQNDYVIICEDDHQFTDDYNKEYLFECIVEAREKKADILSGGVSWFKDAVQISGDLFWVEKFSGSQFIIIFKKFYGEILAAAFSETDAADYKISSLSDKKFIIYPFISTQKEFGYSDVTKKNNEAGFVERIFEESSERLRLLTAVNSFYKMI